MRKLHKFIVGLFTSAVYFFQTPLVHAQTFKDCGKDKVWSPDFQLCIPTDAPGFTSTLYQVGLALIGFVAVLFLILGGYNIMMSRGNLEQFEKGKSFIFYSIAGLLLAIFGFVFIEIITGDIANLPGFGR